MSLGCFPEYSNWAPVVSYLFNYWVGFVELCSNTALDNPICMILEPCMQVLAKLVELPTSILDERKIQVAHVDTPLENT